MLVQVAPERRDRKRVVDRTVENQLRQVARRHEHDLGLLGADVLDRALRHDVFREIRIESISEQSGVGVHDPERDRVPGPIARLLETLAQRGLRGILARIDESRGHLERDSPRAVPILAHEHDVTLFRDRHDLRPRARMYAIKLVPRSVDGRLGDRTLDREHATIGNGLARDLAPVFDRHRITRCRAGRARTRRCNRGSSCSSRRKLANASCSSRAGSPRASRRTASTRHRTAAGRAPSAA